MYNLIRISRLSRDTLFYINTYDINAYMGEMNILILSNSYEKAHDNIRFVTTVC